MFVHQLILYLQLSYIDLTRLNILIGQDMTVRSSKYIDTMPTLLRLQQPSNSPLASFHVTLPGRFFTACKAHGSEYSTTRVPSLSTCASGSACASDADRSRTSRRNFICAAFPKLYRAYQTALSCHSKSSRSAAVRAPRAWSVPLATHIRETRSP